MNRREDRFGVYNPENGTLAGLLCESTDRKGKKSVKNHEQNDSGNKV